MVKYESPEQIISVKERTQSCIAIQIFNEKLNWNARAKVHCWSELDLRKLDRKKALVTVSRQYFLFSTISYSQTKLSYVKSNPSSERVKIITSMFTRHSSLLIFDMKCFQVIADQPSRPRDSRLKDYIWENYKYKSHRKKDKVMRKMLNVLVAMHDKLHDKTGMLS